MIYPSNPLDPRPIIFSSSKSKTSSHLTINFNQEKTKMSIMQKLAWAYAVMFVITASLSYIPGLTDADGMMFGLFSLQLHDDLLHLGSGIWAAIAAYLSPRASTLYFKIFGIMYSLDGVMGLFLGQGYLDAGIYFYGITPLPLTTRIFANLPHILIGGAAVFAGFVLSRQAEKVRAV